MENRFVREDLTKVFITHQKIKAREVLFIWAREVGIHNKIMDDYYKIKSDDRKQRSGKHEKLGESSTTTTFKRCRYPFKLSVKL